MIGLSYILGEQLVFTWLRELSCFSFYWNKLLTNPKTVVPEKAVSGSAVMNSPQKKHLCSWSQCRRALSPLYSAHTSSNLNCNWVSQHPPPHLPKPYNGITLTCYQILNSAPASIHNLFSHFPPSVRRRKLQSKSHKVAVKVKWDNI